MAKREGRAVTVYLPESLLEQVDAMAGNRSEVVRHILEAHFKRTPTDQEIALALGVVFRAAKRARGEEVS